MGFRPAADTVAAMGKGKNRCYVIPSLELVVIRMGDSEGREFSDNQFLAKLLGPSVSTAGTNSGPTDPVWHEYPERLQRANAVWRETVTSRYLPPQD